MIPYSWSLLGGGHVVSNASKDSKSSQTGQSDLFGVGLLVAGCVRSRTAASQKRNKESVGSPSGRFGATRLAGLGRVRPTNPLNSLPGTCRSSWAAIQPTFV